MKKILFFALLLILVGCSNDFYVAQPNQKVLFQYEQSNFAWGRFQHGWFIDDEGYVRTYQQPTAWHYADSSGCTVKTAMDENLGFADSVCFRIDEQVFASKVRLIEKASEGKLTEMKNEMCDFGAIIYRCYTYDSDKQVYHSYLLDLGGDNVQHNTAAEAVALHEWLSGLNSLIYR
jgi:uncharacterized protein YcfL